MKKIFDLIKTMIKVGCIGFGGGSALIPVIEKEVVAKKNMVSREEYDKSVVVASVTPGALTSKLAAGVGYSVASHTGMVAAAVSMSLPGALFTVILLALLSGVEENVLKYVGYIAIPIYLYIIYILIMYMKKTVCSKPDGKQKIIALIIMATVFLLSGGGEIKKITGFCGLMIFDLSSVQILGMAFFVILFLTPSVKWYKICIALLLCLFYSIFSGKEDTNAYFATNIAVLLMIFLGIYSFIYTLVRRKLEWNIQWEKLLRSILIWGIMLVIMSVPALVLCDEACKFIGQGLLSSVMSFGGGDAYLSEAEGFFVHGGAISEETFYGQLIMIVNIFPGSILCKVLTGIGYIMGYEVSGHVIPAIALAIAGFGTSIFGSCVLSTVCMHLYSAFEQLEIFRNIEKWIRTIISGLLISICLSLIMEIINMFL